jgi:hypothetical protein
VDYAVVLNEGGVIRLSSGNSPQMVRGLNALVQAVVMELCSKPLSPQGGSGFVATLFSDSAGSSEAERMMATRLFNARQNILAYQRDADLPADERLADLSLLVVRVVDSGWEVDIRVANAVGESTVISPG